MGGARAEVRLCVCMRVCVECVVSLLETGTPTKGPSRRASVQGQIELGRVSVVLAHDEEVEFAVVRKVARDDVVDRVRVLERGGFLIEEAI